MIFHRVVEGAVFLAVRHVSSIEEFRKKRFRYQCTPYTVEFEAMIINLEKKGEAFEGSLETTLFDRLHYSLKRLLDENEVAALPNAELFA